MKVLKISIFCGALLFPAVVTAGWFSPNDYDSCILENMKGVTNNLAANMIRSSCRKKFPEKTQESVDVELPDSALQKLEGKAGSTNYGYYKGTMFNGNNEWTVTSLEIRITDNKTKTFRDYKAHIRGGYIHEIAPLSTGDFQFETFELPEDRTWTILKVYGHKN